MITNLIVILGLIGLLWVLGNVGKIRKWVKRNRGRVGLVVYLVLIFGAVVAGAVIFSRLLPVGMGNVIEFENEEQAIIAGKVMKDLAIATVAVVVGCVAVAVGLFELSAWWKRRG